MITKFHLARLLREQRVYSLYFRVAEAPCIHVASNRLATSNDLLLCKNMPQSVADESHGKAHLPSEMSVSSWRNDDGGRRRRDEEGREERQNQPETDFAEGRSRKCPGKKATSRSSGRFATRLKSCHTPPVARLRQVNAHSSSSSLARTSRKKHRQLRERFSTRVLYAKIRRESDEISLAARFE